MRGITKYVLLFSGVLLLFPLFVFSACFWVCDLSLSLPIFFFHCSKYGRVCLYAFNLDVMCPDLFFRYPVFGVMNTVSDCDSILHVSVPLDRLWSDAIQMWLHHQALTFEYLEGQSLRLGSIIMHQASRGTWRSVENMDRIQNSSNFKREITPCKY